MKVVDLSPVSPAWIRLRGQCLLAVCGVSMLLTVVLRQQILRTRQLTAGDVVILAAAASVPADKSARQQLLSGALDLPEELGIRPNSSKHRNHRGAEVSSGRDGHQRWRRLRIRPGGAPVLRPSGETRLRIFTTTWCRLAKKSKGKVSHVSVKI